MPARVAAHPRTLHARSHARTRVWLHRPNAQFFKPFKPFPGIETAQSAIKSVVSLSCLHTLSIRANSNRLTSIAKKISDTDIDGVFEATDRAATTRQSLNIEAASNKLLGFNQSVLTQATAANGTRRTLSNVITAVNYQLDANGNLVSDGLRSFDYDGSDRLSQVNITKDFEAAKVSYLTNAAGQRVFKSEPQTAQTLPNESTLGTGFVNWLRSNFQWLWANAQTNASIGTAYTYGEGSLPSWAILGEYDNGSASGNGRVEYIWLPQDDGNAIPIAMFRGARYYSIHSDHLGTPRLIKDDTAKPVWQWAYSAFGDNKPTGILKATTNPNSAITNQPVLLNATTPMEFNLRFPGQYLDQETGQFYNYFRNYQPNQGRYTQNDPIGLNGGWNRFGYVEGNPVTLVDPLGLEGVDITGDWSNFDPNANYSWQMHELVRLQQQAVLNAVTSVAIPVVSGGIVGGAAAICTPTGRAVTVSLLQLLGTGQKMSGLPIPASLSSTVPTSAGALLTASRQLTNAANQAARSNPAIARPSMPTK